jgi:molybdate transport system substrate-binding protein
MPTAEINLLSAGAVAPGIKKVIDAFGSENGQVVNVTFATAPEILKRLTDATSVDVVIAPLAVLDELAKMEKISGANRVTLGRIGVGVLVRGDAPLPQIATIDEFKQSLLSADSLVYNQASTGIYLETLFDRLGIGLETRAKSTRYPDFAAVLDHLSKGARREIGFGATTVIIENSHKGVKFVGPLPAELQNYTAYGAALSANEAAPDAAREFLRYLASPSARALIRAAGLE